MERRKIRRERLRELLLGWLRFLLLVVVVTGSYFGVRYVFQRSELEVGKVKQRKDSPYSFKSNATGMRIVNDNGELAMEITSGEVVLSQDQRTATFKNADAKYYENGQVSLTMHAGNIIYDTQTEDFDLKDGLNIVTKDGMQVTSPEVLWRRAKEAPGTDTPGTKVPAFSFPQGVNVTSREGNRLTASYMQADRELMYMEFVGNVKGDVAELSDTQFITERGLTDIQQLKLKDIKKLGFEAEQVIYDKHQQVMLATSRYYEKAFKIMDLDGREVKIDTYQKTPEQVTFNKEKIIIRCNHLEAHIGRKWAEAVGNIDMVIPPDKPNPNDDKALKVMKNYTTHIRTDDVEYFWGKDYVATHSRSRVEQEDRVALADRITYWGDNPQKRLVLLDGNVTLVNGNGQWMFDQDLVAVENHDMKRAVASYSELTGDRAVVYLNNNDFVASGNAMVRQDERETHADTIVYEDKLKRITADGNVKFRDKDGQTFLCGALVYHDQSHYLQVKGGSVADIRLPAKFANDINRAIADAREQPAPVEVHDPEIAGALPSHNPNAGQPGPELSPLRESGGVGPLPGLPGPLPLPDRANVGPNPPGFIPDRPAASAPPPITPPPGAERLPVGPNRPLLAPPRTGDVAPPKTPAPPATAPAPPGAPVPPGPNIADGDKKPRPAIQGKGR